MRYQSTTGLPAETILEIIARIHQVAHGQGIDFTRHRLTLYKQVAATLMMLGVPGVSWTVVKNLSLFEHVR